MLQFKFQIHCYTCILMAPLVTVTLTHTHQH